MKNINIFISSTFNNLVAERNKIMLAFREADKYAIENYINLKAIDFRWGLPDGAHVMKSCLEAINISKPYFLCILGDEYGSRPTREDYEKEKNYLEEYNQFIDENVLKSSPEENLSYTAMEVYFALSQGFDKEDIRFIYLSYKGNPDSAQKALIRYINQKGFSLVECNSVENLEKEVYKFLKKIITKNSLKVKDPEKDNATSRKYSFNGFAGENTQHNQLMLYRKAQENILNYFIKDTFARKQENCLNIFADSPSKVSCVAGENGAGKSTLVTRWIKSRIEQKRSDEIIIYHFFQGGYVDEIFEHLYLELAEINNRTPEDYWAELLPSNEDLSDIKIFFEAMKQLKTEKRIFIILDGLEHDVIDFATFIEKFFNQKKNIKLILTTGSVPVNSSVPTTVQLQRWEQAEVRYMITDYLRRHNKTEAVSKIIADSLCTSSLLHNPQLLSSVLYDIRVFANHSNINKKIEQYTRIAVETDIYDIIVENWKNIIPAIEDTHILAWIAYSHYGLAESDIKNIAGFHGDKEYLWHQLISFIDPYIRWNGDRLQFSNKWLREAIIKNNKHNESLIKNSMIRYFQSDNISIGKQYDELPHLYKEMNRKDDLLSFLLNFTVFQYANNNKRDTFIEHWSSFALNDFAKYLKLPHDNIKSKVYEALLRDLADFVCFYGLELFPEEPLADIEMLHSSIAHRIVTEQELKKICCSKEKTPSDMVNSFRIEAVSYIHAGEFKKARKVLNKGIKLLKPVVKEAMEFYNTSVWLQDNNDFPADEKTVKPFLTSISRTSLLEALNPYIALLGEILNTHPDEPKARECYNEAMECIEKLEQIQEEDSVRKSSIEYAYGVILYDKQEYRSAFEKLNSSFDLKYNYLTMKLNKLHKNDMHQAYRLMETYKIIESCQVKMIHEGVASIGDAFLYENQERYIEAIEKFGENLIDLGRFDSIHYCNCLLNYANYLKMQVSDKDDNGQKGFLKKAKKYYEKAISATKHAHHNDLYIIASWEKIECLLALETEENECDDLVDAILEREKILSSIEYDNQAVKQILENCHLITESAGTV